MLTANHRIKYSFTHGTERLALPLPELWLPVNQLECVRVNNCGMGSECEKIVLATTSGLMHRH
jgi:hypothetical protein